VNAAGCSLYGAPSSSPTVALPSASCDAANGITLYLQFTPVSPLTVYGIRFYLAGATTTGCSGGPLSSISITPYLFSQSNSVIVAGSTVLNTVGSNRWVDFYFLSSATLTAGTVYRIGVYTPAMFSYVYPGVAISSLVSPTCGIGTFSSGYVYGNTQPPAIFNSPSNSEATYALEPIFESLWGYE